MKSSKITTLSVSVSEGLPKRSLSDQVMWVSIAKWSDTPAH